MIYREVIMGKLISKIVLTGGPCSGKTTSLNTIQQELTKKGYTVFIVNETPTELIKSGLNCSYSDIDQFSFESFVFNHQLNKEKLYEESISCLPADKKVVIIYDRGIMDIKSYLTPEEFYRMLNSYQLDESKLKNNYDMVLHLVTAANGKESFYTVENNSARLEQTIEEARQADERTLTAWLGHPNLKVIDNSTDFDNKVSRVINTIFQHLEPDNSTSYLCS